MDLDAALTFARDHKRGVLITLKADGRLVLRLRPTHAYGMA
jgi:hypothetical protein